MNKKDLAPVQKKLHTLAKDLDTKPEPLFQMLPGGIIPEERGFYLEWDNYMFCVYLNDSKSVSVGSNVPNDQPSTDVLLRSSAMQTVTVWPISHHQSASDAVLAMIDVIDEMDMEEEAPDWLNKD